MMMMVVTKERVGKRGGEYRRRMERNRSYVAVEAFARWSDDDVERIE